MFCQKFFGFYSPIVYLQKEFVAKSWLQFSNVILLKLKINLEQMILIEKI